MNRRQALLAAITLLGGIVLDGPPPVWAYEGTRAARGQPGRFFNAREMALLTDVAEIMIPATDTPGATAANVPGVIDGLMLDWAVPATRMQFRQALADIDAKAAPHGFMDRPPAERAALLTGIDIAAFQGQGPADQAYRRLKQLIWYAYFTSEGADPDYVAVPGQYRGDLTRGEMKQLVMGAR